ncbi:hypothetical protein [Piscinibacter koreensis]|uniref:Uncharacterized protein n=1 Tax=Piscinibacter koreensis TaxID=2742824 RepID=A0A7Y6TVT8_9BURK|nr:hypothetical protein [Schlegelella koreensis]NUZ05343.1 hypothetical protein [Schlegelella koreensis]
MLSTKAIYALVAVASLGLAGVQASNVHATAVEATVVALAQDTGAPAPTTAARRALAPAAKH